MKRNSNWKSAGKAAGTFAAGAATGGALALLFAPASGKAMRQRIGSKLNKTRKMLVKQANTLQHQALGQIEHTRDWLMTRAVHRNGNGKRFARPALRKS